MPDYTGKHLMFLGIQVWDAAVANFQVPEGSKPRPCILCREATYVQRSSLKLIAAGHAHSVICYRCARKLPLGLIREGDVEVVPEARAEIEQMIKARRQ